MIFSHLKFLLRKKENVLLYVHRLILIPFSEEKKVQYNPAPTLPKFAPLHHSHKKFTAVCGSGIVRGATVGLRRGGSGVWGERGGAMGNVVGGRQ